MKKRKIIAWKAVRWCHGCDHTADPETFIKRTSQGQAKLVCPKCGLQDSGGSHITLEFEPVYKA